MSVSPVAGGALLSAIVMAVASAVVHATCEVRAKRYGLSCFRDRCFRVSWIGYFWPIVCMGLGAFLLVDTRGTQYGGWLTFVIALGIIAGAIFLMQSNARSMVLMNGGNVRYIEGGRERWNLSLGDILGVSIYQWNFLIRARWMMGKPILLPMHFTNSALLLAMLRNYRPDERLNDR